MITEAATLQTAHHDAGFVANPFLDQHALIMRNHPDLVMVSTVAVKQNPCHRCRLPFLFYAKPNIMNGFGWMERLWNCRIWRAGPSRSRPRRPFFLLKLPPKYGGNDLWPSLGGESEPDDRWTQIGSYYSRLVKNTLYSYFIVIWGPRNGQQSVGRKSKTKSFRDNLTSPVNCLSTANLQTITSGTFTYLTVQKRFFKSARSEYPPLVSSCSATGSQTVSGLLFCYTLIISNVSGLFN
jgi:hypothetical protein